ncbi:MAG: alkaline phosphatase family protein [Saprospiraceae bacterium]|nr:alkaline phosphatase family protein [Candidatus Vicinibacter affinis]
MPPVNDNGDLKVLGFTVELLRWFKPRVTVVDLNNIDVCHNDFTAYLKNIHRADHGIAFLWKEIQSIPGMRDNTVMIVMPEHGRDEQHNSIKDLNDWFATTIRKPQRPQDI